jgi:glycosyltransferase involved in cell wall biosynthesis
MLLNKKVTVLMPVYNGEKYLREAIESILNQTYKDFDLLIINDGSTDNSHFIIQDWINNNGDVIKVKYINRENKGLTIKRTK